MIQFTHKAIAQVKRIKEQQQIREPYLRIGVKKGGCSGLSYTMFFEKDCQESDQVFECDGLQVVIDGRSLHFITGAVIDFKEDLEGSGFVFKNPNVRSSCGCGKSFTA